MEWAFEKNSRQRRTVSLRALGDVIAVWLSPNQQRGALRRDHWRKDIGALRSHRNDVVPRVFESGWNSSRFWERRQNHQALGCADGWSHQDRSVHTTSFILAISISSDHNAIASGTEDGLICQWDVRTGRYRPAVLRHDGRGTALSFSPMDSSHRGTGRCCCFSPDGRLVACVTTNTIYARDVTNPKAASLESRSDIRNPGSRPSKGITVRIYRLLFLAAFRPRRLGRLYFHGLIDTAMSRSQLQASGPSATFHNTTRLGSNT